MTAQTSFRQRLANAVSRRRLQTSSLFDATAIALTCEVSDPVGLATAVQQTFTDRHIPLTVALWTAVQASDGVLTLQQQFPGRHQNGTAPFPADRRIAAATDRVVATGRIEAMRITLQVAARVTETLDIRLIPVHVSDKMLGVVGLQGPPGVFSAVRLQDFTAFGRSIALRILQISRNHAAHLTAKILELADKTRSVKSFVTTIAALLLTQFEASACSIFLYDSRSEELSLVAMNAPRQTVASRAAYRLGDGLTGRLGKTRGVLRINNLEPAAILPAVDSTGRVSEIADPLAGPHHFLGAALTTRKASPKTEDLLGVVQLIVSGTPIGFTHSTELLLSNLASPLAVAIELVEHRESESDWSNILTAQMHAIREGRIDDFLNRLLAACIETTGAGDGYIAAVRPGTVEVELKAVRGLSSERRGTARRVGVGIAGKAIDTMKPVCVGTLSQRSELVSTKNSQFLKSELAVPIVYKGSAVGVINLHHQTEHFFTSRDIRTMELLARVAGETFGAIRAASESRVRLESLIRVIQEMAGGGEYSAVLRVIAEELRRFFDVSYVAILSVRNNRLTVEENAGSGSDIDVLRGAVRKFNSAGGPEGLVAYVAATRQPMALPDVSSRPANIPYIEVRPTTRSELCVPVLSQGKLVAVLNLESDTVGRFTPDDSETIDLVTTFGAQVALILRHALEMRVREDMRQRTEDRQRQAIAAQLSSSLRHEVAHMAQIVTAATRSLAARCQALTDNEPALATINDQLDVLRRVVSRLAGLAEKYRVILKRGNKERETVSDISVNDVIRDCIELCRERLDDKRMTPTFELDQTLGDDAVPAKLIFRGAPGDLQSVILNLILNAVHFSYPRKPLEIRTRLDTASSNAKRFAVASVTDFGTGIADEDQPSIFIEGFSRRDGGTGIGLAHSLTIAKSWGGQISFDSKKGKGSTFYVLIPVEEPSA